MKHSPATCPITKTATLLSDTWTMLIVRTLLDNEHGFCELERALDGISTRTLTLKLQKLEKEKMIQKNSDSKYSLTEQGLGLRNIIRSMRTYGEKFL